MKKNKERMKIQDSTILDFEGFASVVEHWKGRVAKACVLYAFRLTERFNHAFVLITFSLNLPGRPTNVTFISAVLTLVKVENFFTVPESESPLNSPLIMIAFTPERVTLQLIVILTEKVLWSTSCNMPDAYEVISTYFAVDTA